jgi:hypothetical protein
METQTIRDTLGAARRMLADLQANARGSDGTVTADDWERLLSVGDYIGQSLLLLEGKSPGEWAVQAAVEDEFWADLVSGASGLAGRQKWLAGSTGMDIFVRRKTEVRAPIAGTMRFELEQGGPTLIGKMMIVHDDGRTVRFRHVEPAVANGRVALHQVVARVFDQSMDMLRWPLGYPRPPDGYQHLDLSLASRPEFMNPTGGAGGNVRALDHVWGKKGGVPRIELIARTPGPMEGTVGPLRVAWAQWAGQEVNAWESARLSD